MYSSLFHHMEDVGLLDPTNELHFFFLQYVFIPLINRHLGEWKQGWLLHPMSSEHNTPYQLWTSGMQAVSSSSIIGTEMFEQLEEVQ